MILKPIIDKEAFYALAIQSIGVWASKDWLSIYKNKLTVVGIYQDDLQMIGGFYFVNQKTMGLRYLKLPPYTPHCGLFYLSESKKASSQLNFTKEIITEVCNYLQAQKFSLCVLAFPSQIADMQPFIWNGFKVVPNYTYRINLSQSIEQIVSNFDSKNKNAINKAIKDHIEIQSEQLVPKALFEYFFEALNKAGANVYKEELQAVFMEYSRPENSFALQAKLGDKIVGSVFCIYDSKNCYYLLGAVDKNAGVQGINNLLILKCIEKAKHLGCEIFDFEGSMLKGVEKFFRSFGPIMIPYYTINKANIVLEMLLKFKKRSLF